MTRKHIRPTQLLSALGLLLLIALLFAFQKTAQAWSGADISNTVQTSTDRVKEKPKVKKPRIVQDRIPFSARRRHQMADYSKRHYGKRTWKLKKPKVIVQHYSVTPDIPSLFNTFASNQPDPEFGELPNVCAHFGVSRSGRIFQFVPLSTRCRHTVGLNYTSIGIEHVGYSDGEVLSNSDQMKGSLKLTKWLRCRYDIRIRNVIGHNESLRSPYHREKVDALKHATHGDFRRGSMNKYRKQLRQKGRC